jgi:hypothetical protein
VLTSSETSGPLIDSHGNIAGEKKPLVSLIDDTSATLKPKDSMPKYFKEMERHALKIYNN